MGGGGGGAQRSVWRGRAQKDGCAQCTGVHARPKPTSYPYYPNWKNVGTVSRSLLKNIVVSALFTVEFGKHYACLSRKQ